MHADTLAWWRGDAAVDVSEAEFDEILAEVRRREAVEREEAQALWRLHTLKRCGFPSRHIDKLAEITANREESRWWSTFQRLYAALGQGFVSALLGPRGPGKTQLAVCLACAALRRDPNWGVTYVRAADLFRELRASFRRHGPDEREIVAEYARPRLLVIDEAHERGHSAFELSALSNLIDIRYGDKLDTLLISNETREGFSEAIGPSVVSRIQETGGAIICDWPSFRTPPGSAQP